MSKLMKKSFIICSILALAASFNAFGQSSSEDLNWDSPDWRTVNKAYMSIPDHARITKSQAAVMTKELANELAKAWDAPSTDEYIWKAIGDSEFLCYFVTGQETPPPCPVTMSYEKPTKDNMGRWHVMLTVKGPGYEWGKHELVFKQKAGTEQFERSFLLDDFTDADGKVFMKSECIQYVNSLLPEYRDIVAGMTLEGYIAKYAEGLKEEIKDRGLEAVIRDYAKYADAVKAYMAKYNFK